MEAQHWGSLYLPLERWNENLKGRKGSVEKYRECWEQAHEGGIQVRSNQETTREVQRLVEEWVANLARRDVSRFGGGEK
jgi:mannose-6-phosphate isomerase class I